MASPLSSVSSSNLQLSYGNLPVWASSSTRSRAFQTFATVSEARPLFAQNLSLFEILGVSATASAKELKAAYKGLVRHYHPDAVRDESKEECTQKFLQIHAAYATLSDPESRAKYELELQLRHRQRFWDVEHHDDLAECHSWHCGKNWETDQCW